jgi:hypothetical protein
LSSRFGICVNCGGLGSLASKSRQAILFYILRRRANGQDFSQMSKSSALQKTHPPRRFSTMMIIYVQDVVFRTTEQLFLSSIRKLYSSPLPGVSPPQLWIYTSSRKPSVHWLVIDFSASFHLFLFIMPPAR